MAISVEHDHSASQPPGLTWEATFEIVLALKEAHPNANVEDIGIHQLLEWIVALPNFVDDQRLVNDSVLTDVIREWYEEDHT